MLVARRSPSVIAFMACLSMTGCLVSFEDYPLGLGGSGGLVSASGSGSGGSPAGGSSAGDIAAGGSTAGDSAMAGTTTGGSSVGGADGGTAGTSQGGFSGAPTPAVDGLIDDFEDGDSQIALIAGRNGSWFISNDGTPQGQQTPDPHMACLPSLLAPPRGASARALHTAGSGFNTWGAMVGANFLAMGTIAAPYDISAYQGLTFAAKLGKVGAAKQVRVSIRNFDTLYGCTSCGDHFGATVTIGDTFQTINVPFSDLKQQGWGKPLVSTFDTTRTYAVTFVWAARQSFDAWIDDLSFY